MMWPRRLRHGEEATLVEHLEELRWRIILSLLAVAVAFGVAMVFSDQTLNWLQQPLPPKRRDNIVTLGVTEPFFLSIRISLYTALAATLPIWLWQMWSFLAPAIEERQQRVILV